MIDEMLLFRGNYHKTFFTTMTPEENKRIEDTLGIGPSSYYVYALCTDSGPFYIGKGKGLRRLMKGMKG